MLSEARATEQRRWVVMAAALLAAPIPGCVGQAGVDEPDSAPGGVEDPDAEDDSDSDAGTGLDSPALRPSGLDLQDLVSREALLAPVDRAGTGTLVAGEDSGIDHVHALSYSDEDRWLDDFGGGLSALDCDVDGDLDLFFTVSDGPDVLYLNDGRGRFTRTEGLLPVIKDEGGAASDPVDLGGVSTAASQADFDNDGDPDLLVLRQHAANRLLVNDGNCTFEDRTLQAGLEDTHRSLHATWVDLDSDGSLDLYVTNWAAPSPGGEVGLPPDAQADRLWLGNGDGTFSDISEQLPVENQGSSAGGNPSALGMVTAFLDFDDDGLLDLFHSNDRGMVFASNRVYRNLGVDEAGAFQFEDVSADVGFGLPMNGMGLAVADVDGDAAPDVLLTGNFETILRWEEPGFFLESGAVLGLDAYDPDVVSWAGVFFDPDADGDQDLYFVQSNVFPHGFFDVQTYGRSPRFFRNDIGETGLFERLDLVGSAAAAQTSRSLLAEDLDGDGYEDLVHGNVQSQPTLVFSRPAESGNILQVRLHGTASNRDGRGARVLLGTGDRTQVRWPGAVESFGSGGTTRMSFGLGDADSADWIRVIWPSGTVQDIGTQPAGHVVHITEPLH